MKKSHFIRELDRGLIESEIRAAELKTSGEIRVMIHHQPVADPVAAASAAFLRLGMNQTKARNAVLIFVAPESQKFAVIGDEAVHRQCGAAFWTELAAAMTGHFKAARFTEGLQLGIARAGALLAEHFPRRADDADELSDEIIEE